MPFDDSTRYSTLHAEVVTLRAAQTGRDAELRALFEFLDQVGNERIEKPFAAKAVRERVDRFIK